MRTRMRLATEPSSVPTVRRAVQEALGSFASVGVMDDMRLLASEVASNAVRHARTPIGSEFELVVDLTGARVRVEVIDGGVGFDVPAPTGPHDVEPGAGVGGYGLYLVDTLSDRWGTITAPRFGVWFERDLSPD